MIMYNLVWDAGETAGAYLAGTVGGGGVQGFRTAAAVMGAATAALALAQWALQVGSWEAGGAGYCCAGLLLLAAAGPWS
jgi:hypothetical protein